MSLSREVWEADLARANELIEAKGGLVTEEDDYGGEFQYVDPSIMGEEFCDYYRELCSIGFYHGFG